LSRWNDFQNDPFAYVDQLRLSLKGNNLNIFQKYHKIQRTAFVGAMVFLAMWIIFGFDSSPLQLIIPLYEVLPHVLTGQAHWADMLISYSSYYGKEMHYSAIVIYFLLYWALSKTWEKAGVYQSKNMVFSFGGMFLAIGIFEWFWILGFSYFQNQPWVSTWQFPQMKILLQNTFLTLAGGLTVLFMLTERWHWNGKIQEERIYYFQARQSILWLFVGISVASALLWIFYPWPVQLLTVQLENGQIWQSSRLFPQTLYTVELTPGDEINAGVWFWIQDDLIHAVNTGVKAIWAATIYLLFRAVPGNFEIEKHPNSGGAG